MRWLDHINEYVGRATSWLSTGLVLLIVYDVIMRYAFRSTHVWMQELEWHLFALIFLLGAAYTFKDDGHVRVDVFYQRWSPKARAWVNILGIVFLMLPFCIVILNGAWLYTIQAWAIREGSPDPAGLPARYLIKGAIVVAFLLLTLQGILELVKHIRTLSSPSDSTPDA